MSVRQRHVLQRHVIRVLQHEYVAARTVAINERSPIRMIRIVVAFDGHARVGGGDGDIGRGMVNAGIDADHVTRL